MRTIARYTILSTVVLVIGCQQKIIEQTDRSVYRVIEKRQQDALGEVSNAQIGPETGKVAKSARMYSFVPQPLDPELPEAFQQGSPAPVPAADEGQRDDGDNAAERDDEETLSAEIFSKDERAKAQTFALNDALAYAMSHGRDLQNAKEDLFLAALDLTLERHLWTPQWVASVQGDYANYGQVRDFDNAMSAVADVAVSQRLPYGGEVTAQIVGTLMRDLGRHITSGETGSLILDANIPLLRGAGRVAYESRYQAERDLIYAVRTYERFRRSYLVNVAADFFSLQQSKAAIDNAYKSYLSRNQDWEKADFINRLGQSQTVFDASRARSSLRSAEAGLVSAKEQLASALDRFKISIGMSVDVPLAVLSQDADENAAATEALLPDVSESAAVAVAVAYRLDLLNNADAVDDTKRGVDVARNSILPDLDLTGSVAMATDPNQKNALSYNTERTTWRGGIELRLDDRKTERNAFRSSLISLRRAQRNHEESVDTVRADVRRARRRIEQADNLRLIQAMNVDENEIRLLAARAQFDLGQVDNQDVVDAENDLLAARNSLARAVADYRVAILEFRLDTGTLRVTDDGRWAAPGLFEPAAPADGPVE